jgi:hypothetical protein
MGKLQLTGQNLGRVFNSKTGFMYPMRIYCFEAKLHNLKLKTRPKQLLGYILFDITLPGSDNCHVGQNKPKFLIFVIKGTLFFCTYLTFEYVVLSGCPQDKCPSCEIVAPLGKNN